MPAVPVLVYIIDDTPDVLFTVVTASRSAQINTYRKIVRPFSSMNGYEQFLKTPTAQLNPSPPHVMIYDFNIIIGDAPNGIQMYQRLRHMLPDTTIHLMWSAVDQAQPQAQTIGLRFLSKRDVTATGLMREIDQLISQHAPERFERFP